MPVSRATAGYLSDRTLRGLFKDLEAIAGVPHLQGRALYGLRRQATDLALEFADDARVLDSIKDAKRARAKDRQGGERAGTGEGGKARADATFMGGDGIGESE